MGRTIKVDQQSSFKRSQLIQKLAKTYESASRVLSWVDEKDDPTVFGRSSPIPIQHIFATVGNIARFIADPSNVLMPQLGYHYLQYWMDGLVSFERRPWFQQLW